jgi:predicted Rossmann fold flavoprotein
MDTIDIAIIGGGAAGFFGAVTCGRANPSAKIRIFEKTRQLLTKVRISGGGRCNVTHACFEPSSLIRHYPRGQKALLGPFSKFQPKDTIEWFEKRGVVLKVEQDGRMFPVTDDSSTIVTCLMTEAESLGVEVHCETEVAGIERLADGGFSLIFDRKNPARCGRVLFACGGSARSYRLIESLGHKIAPPVPSLFTFNISDPRLENLSGVSLSKVRVGIPEIGLEETGPLLITHWGMSGPAVLKISAWGARKLHDLKYRATLEVNWLPDWTSEQVHSQLRLMKETAAKKIVAAESCFNLPKNLWKKLLEHASIDHSRLFAYLSKNEMLRLEEALLRSKFAVEGKSTYKEEFVTCGGVCLDEVNFKTMESRICPGVHFAGEILDIDGVTGGFNFQNAWTTAWLAGQAMALN